MDLSKLTQKSQEAIQEAQALAIERGSPQVDGEHLLASLLNQDRGLVPSLLKKMEVPMEGLRQAVSNALDALPRVSGPGASTMRARRATKHFWAMRPYIAHA